MQEFLVFVCLSEIILFIITLFTVWAVYDWLEFFHDWRHARIYLPKAIKSVSLLVFMIFMNFSSGDLL